MSHPVLIVDDDQDAREMLETLFDVSGVEAQSAATARIALTMARAVQPCVILLDLHLPEVDGIAFRRLQRQDPEIASIPVVVVSADPDAAAIARELQADGWLRKPVDFDALLDKVHDLCD